MSGFLRCDRCGAEMDGSDYMFIDVGGAARHPHCPSEPKPAGWPTEAEQATAVAALAMPPRASSRPSAEFALRVAVVVVAAIGLSLFTLWLMRVS